MAECELCGWDDCEKREAHRAVLALRREGSAPPWSPIVRGSDAGGVRDFLDGEAIHCGAGLLLQEIAYKHDDHGEYTVKLPKGVPVRYELVWQWKEGEQRAMVLYSVIGGHEFSSPHAVWMRFRWPPR